MTRKMFQDRKTVKVYIGAVDYLHIIKKAGGPGKVSAWIRGLIEKAMGWDK